MNGAGPLQIVFGVLALWTTTILVMVIDKKIRASQSDFAPSMTEPEWGGLIALTILCNVAALPYYFWRSRNSVGWGLLGFPLFGVCLVCLLIGNVLGAIFDSLLHLR